MDSAQLTYGRLSRNKVGWDLAWRREHLTTQVKALSTGWTLKKIFSEISTVVR